ncbi:uncharacterized protein LOC128995393 [Macrosteles quadrilineatus]|uniref:uncharacterized protein LOC128995393 n=1 Tax=Macrosteles quadrilineatus TaxID=74068 RepID=UPI0023E156C5|nr:uncharacterized protein LOC128995393 [Macrosteles quadrilineatus]
MPSLDESQSKLTWLKAIGIHNGEVTKSCPVGSTRSLILESSSRGIMAQNLFPLFVLIPGILEEMESTFLRYNFELEVMSFVNCDNCQSQNTCSTSAMNVSNLVSKNHNSLMRSLEENLVKGNGKQNCLGNTADAIMISGPILSIGPIDFNELASRLGKALQSWMGFGPKEKKKEDMKEAEKEEVEVGEKEKVKVAENLEKSTETEKQMAEKTPEGGKKE